jgi:hypothetical protein
MIEGLLNGGFKTKTEYEDPYKKYKVASKNIKIAIRTTSATMMGRFSRGFMCVLYHTKWENEMQYNIMS